VRQALGIALGVLALLAGAWAFSRWMAVPEGSADLEAAGTGGGPTLRTKGAQQPAPETVPRIEPRALFEGFSSKDSRQQIAAYDAAVKAERIPFDEDLVRLMVAWLQSDNRVLVHRANVVLQRVGPRAEPFTAPLLRSENDNARYHALSLYSSWKGRGFAGVPSLALLPFLEDKSYSVQQYAMHLVTSGIPYDEGVALWLKDRIRPGPGAAWYGPEVALANMGDEGFAYVVAMLEDPKLHYNGLGGLRGAPLEKLRTILPRIEAFIADDSDEDAQVAAIRLLFRFQGDIEPVLPTLRRVLKGESYPVRVEALMALEQMEERAAPALEGLLVALADRDERIASRAAGILAATRAAPETVLPALGAALAGDAGDQAGAALGAYGPAAVPYLRAALDGSDEDERYNALYGVAALGPQGAPLAGRVIALLDHEDYDVQVRAAATLGALGDAGKAGIPAILRLLHDDTLTPGATAGVLMQIGEASEPALLAALRTEDDVGKARIVDVLSAFHGRSAFALEALTPFLRHADVRVRRAAVTAVVASTWPESTQASDPAAGRPALWRRVRALIAPLEDDPDPGIRELVALNMKELDRRLGP